MSQVLTKHYSWRRLTLAMAILGVIAFSSMLKLPAEVVTALVVAFSTAAQFFFQQHGEENKKPSPTQGTP